MACRGDESCQAVYEIFLMLTRRQQRLYEDVADIYSPDSLTMKTGSKRMQDVSFVPTPVATNVKGMFMSSVENAHGGSSLGRDDVDNLFTLDRWRCAANARQDDGSPLIINDGWVIHLKTSGSPDRLGWWICQGGSKIRPIRRRRQTNTQTVNVSRTLKPSGIS